MPHYEIKPGPPNTPLCVVYRDGAKLQEFTSLAAAKAYVDHVTAHELKSAIRDLVAGRDNVRDAIIAMRANPPIAARFMRSLNSTDQCTVSTAINAFWSKGNAL